MVRRETGNLSPILSGSHISKKCAARTIREKQCTLSGDMLYLIDSIASDQDFTQPVSVPSGFADTSLTVPRPNGTVLYIKLRDDPATINTAVLPVLPDQYSIPAS